MNRTQENRAARVFDMLLKQYEKILKEGSPIVVKEKDENGEWIDVVKMIPPSAAMCRAIHAFLDKHNIGKAPASAHGSIAEEADRRMKFRGAVIARTGPKIPPVSTDDDAATG